MKQFLILTLFLCIANLNLQAQEYTDPVRKFTIKYPETWAKTEIATGVYFASPLDNELDSFAENVNIIIQDLSNNKMSLEHYTELSLKQVKDMFANAKIESKKETTLAGQKAVELVWKMDYAGKSLKLKQYWFIKENQAYVFTFTATEITFPKFEAMAMASIKSFRFN